MTIGFEHAKLRYMYDEEGRKKKLREMVSQTGKELLFLEGGEYLRYGLSIGLDPISVTKHIDGKLLMVIGGNEDILMDDAIFVKNYVEMTGSPSKGDLQQGAEHGGLNGSPIKSKRWASGLVLSTKGANLPRSIL
jgi:hypothetical protein